MNSLSEKAAGVVSAFGAGGSGFAAIYSLQTSQYVASILASAVAVSTLIITGPTLAIRIRSFCAWVKSRFSK